MVDPMSSLPWEWERVVLQKWLWNRSKLDPSFFFFSFEVLRIVNPLFVIGKNSPTELSVPHCVAMYPWLA